jgi:WD40 repeat protein
MSRIAFLVLFTGLATIAFDFPAESSALAQEKGKKKKAQALAPPAKADDIKEDFSRVLPVFDPGSHTQPISAMGFTKDNKKLVTVGQDFSVQVWSTATGERLDILRLPGFGREKGYDAGRWDIAAISADGTSVAVGGQMKLLSAEGDDRTGRLVIVDVVKRTVNRVQIRTGLNRPVTAVAFSPSGDTLAMAIEKGPKEGPELIIVGDLTTRIKNANPLIRTQDCQHVTLPGTATQLAFSPDGKGLLVGAGQKVLVWDIPGGVAPAPQLVKEITVKGVTTSLAWSVDGTQFARTVDGPPGPNQRGVELWNGDGTQGKSWMIDDLKAVVPQYGRFHFAHFLDAKTLYFVANGNIEKNQAHGSIAGTLDVVTGEAKRVSGTFDGLLAQPVGAAAADSSLVAVTVTGNTEVLIGPPVPGKPKVRCGNQSQLPYHVGWAKDAAKPGFAWTNERRGSLLVPSADILTFGFDLARVEPVGEIVGNNYAVSTRKIGDWTLESQNTNVGKAHLKQNVKLVQSFTLWRGLGNTPGIGFTLVPSPDKPNVAFATNDRSNGDELTLYSTEKNQAIRLMPRTTRTTDMASSPDGRFLIATTGTPRIVVYRTDGSTYPLLSFAQLNGEWVIWTPEGYYAASPGGEKMFGWAINNGANALVTFHAAERYAQKFRRPDIIKLAIEKGSIKEALAASNAKPLELNEITPPEAKLTLLAKSDTKVTVKATASSGSKEKPITTMRLLLDGRPLGDGKGTWTPDLGMGSEPTFDIEIPPGQHELKLLVRSAEGATVSEAIVVKGGVNISSKPTLYRLCIGIDQYQDSSLKLAAAAQDAKDIFDSLAANCVGESNRFGKAEGELILNQNATVDRVLQALKKARKATKPGDLLVIFFAGHGVKQDLPAGDGKDAQSQFYLLTHEANVQKDLKGFSLSGDDLRKSLAEVECPVLMILDACHSAKAVKFLRPATDDLTRTMTDDTVGVTVMSAAMSHETAGATSENGYFTAGLLKGLRAEAGVPFDPYERQVYVHHLYSVAFSEVRKATNGKQNPFLNMPWTSPPIPIREVHAK